MQKREKEREINSEAEGNVIRNVQHKALSSHYRKTPNENSFTYVFVCYFFLVVILAQKKINSLDNLPTNGKGFYAANLLSSLVAILKSNVIQKGKKILLLSFNYIVKINEPELNQHDGKEYKQGGGKEGDGMAEKRNGRRRKEMQKKQQSKRERENRDKVKINC